MITNYESIMNYSIWFGHPQVVDPLDLEYLEDNGIHGGVPDGCFAINFLKDCDKKKRTIYSGYEQSRPLHCADGWY